MGFPTLPTGGERDEAAPEGAAPDLAAAAETLGVSVAELESALGGPPPDFETAAESLNVSLDDLMAALPADGVSSQAS